jgi:hypothetical protein
MMCQHPQGHPVRMPLSFFATRMLNNRRANGAYSALPLIVNFVVTFSL